jgi:NADPH2:quinone reductase
MTHPMTMKKIQINSFGGPEVLTLVETDLPKPKSGEVLIKNEAAGVNFSDILRRRNTYFMPTPLPYTLGAEAVGTIVELGPDTAQSHLEVGTRVLAILPHGGAYGEFLTAPAHFCVPLPPHIPSEAATAIFVQGTTAYLLIHQIIKDLEGKSILIHGAAGGVGSILVQLAKLAGASKVIGTASSKFKCEKILNNGADAAINYSDSHWTKMVIEVNGGEKVDYILEMIGGEIFTESFKCLRPGGTIVVYGQASGKKGFIHSEHYVDESHNLRSFNLAHFIGNHMEKWQQALGSVIGLLTEGKLNISVTNSYNFKDAAKAHQDLENRNTTGKVVLTF